MTYPKWTPPTVLIVGVNDRAEIQKIQSAFAYTDRAKVNVLPAFEALDLVVGAAGLVIKTDELTEHKNYLSICRGEMGPNTPFTLMLTRAATAEEKQICDELRITRIVVHENPGPLEYVAEAYYLIATHKFRNARTGDIV